MAEPEKVIPADLLGVSVVVCVKVNDDGFIDGAYVLDSTTDRQKDLEVIVTTRQFHWNKLPPGDPSRNIWFPMGLNFGDVAAPLTAPATCAAPPKGPLVPADGAST